MDAKQEQILDSAMSLTADQRADLIDRLLDSLDVPTDGAIEKAWADEAEDRLAAYHRGELKGIPLTTAIEQLKRHRS